MAVTISKQSSSTASCCRSLSRSTTPSFWSEALAGSAPRAARGAKPDPGMGSLPRAGFPNQIRSRPLEAGPVSARLAFLSYSTWLFLCHRPLPFCWVLAAQHLRSGSVLDSLKAACLEGTSRARLQSFGCALATRVSGLFSQKTKKSSNTPTRSTDSPLTSISI